MIMERQCPQQADENDSTTTDAQNVEPVRPLHKIIQDVLEIKEKLNIKDNEIRDLNEQLKTAHATIARLSRRVSLLEVQEATRQEEAATRLGADESIRMRQQQLPPSAPTKTLILGDTNLNCISPRDLYADSSIRTINEATVDILRSWVDERLNWIPKKCILYCGLYDALNGKLPSKH